MCGTLFQYTIYILFLGCKVTSSQLEEAVVQSGVLEGLMTTLSRNSEKNVIRYCLTLSKLLLKIVQLHILILRKDTLHNNPNQKILLDVFKAHTVSTSNSYGFDGPLLWTLNIKTVNIWKMSNHWLPILLIILIFAQLCTENWFNLHKLVFKAELLNIKQQ